MERHSAQLLHTLAAFRSELYIATCELDAVFDSDVVCLHVYGSLIVQITINTAYCRQLPLIILARGLGAPTRSILQFDS